MKRRKFASRWACTGLISAISLSALIGAMLLLIKTVGQFVGANTAQWVQALGSILALVGAFVIMHRQNAHVAAMSLDAERRTLVRQAKIVAVLADKLRFEIEWFTGLLSHSESPAAILWEHREQELFTEILPVFDTIPLYSLGSERLVRGVFEIKKAAADLRRLVETAARIPKAQFDFSDLGDKNIRKHSGSIRLRAAIAHDLVNSGRDELSVQ